MYEELSQRVDSALQLKERIGNFMDVERPFQQLRSDAETLRGQVDGTAENMTKLQDQNGRTMEAQKQAAAKLEAIERRCEELGRVLQDKEHRVSAVEEATQKIDGLQQTIDDLTREIGTLKERSGALEDSFRILDMAFQKQSLLLSSTPSIYPVRGLMGNGYGWRRDPFRQFALATRVVAKACARFAARSA